MQKRLVTIHNKAGIHCRPSSVILNTLNESFPDHTVQITVDGETTDITGSILALISLGLTYESSATLCIEGPNEEQAIKTIGDLFENEFDFPPQ